MGMAYREQDNLDEAITCYQKALNLNPSLVKAHYHMGYSLQDQGKLDEAIACYRTALELQPDPGVEVQTCLVDPIIFDSTDSIQQRRNDMVRELDSLRKKGITLEDPHEQVGRANFYLAYHGLNSRELQEKIASFYLTVCPELSWQAPHCSRQRKRRGKVRLGIISRFLYNHTIGRLTLGVIRHLSREKFYVTVFQFLDNEDPLSQLIRSEADKGVILSTRLASARYEIAQQALDILLYLDIGMDSLTYFLSFSRLARIQCVTWGHPDTTGTPNVDYFLSSEHAEPPDGQSHYTEQLIRLKGFPMYCYRPEPPTKAPSRQAFGLSEDVNLYVCVQSLFKVHPDFDKILRDILCRDSQAMLIFFELENRHVTGLLRDRFAQAFPDKIERVRFQPRLSFEEFSSFLTLADVVLDTPHFNGGYTSLLCFAAGVPVVTWPGRFMRGRLTLGFYKQMGFADCVANNAQAYAEIALKLANDRTWRKQVQETIRKRAHVLYEDIEAVRDLERFLEWAIQHHG
jgi:predicted O-linked N-acetylglucosamine transferase (SPINDLY family)